MCATDQLRRAIPTDDPAFAWSETNEGRWAELARAHAALEGWYWGPRTSLAECCEVIRAWLAAERPLDTLPPADP